MCFDTTASNTGKFAGACILLEALNGYPLLWTSCRHHMLEIILGDVFKAIFGPTSSPRVDFFDILRFKWSELDLTAIDFSEFAFQRPGAQHHAQWMSAPIYAFKMYLFHNQLELDTTLLRRLKRFCNFVSFFYTSYWLQCPLASEAALNDLQFYQSVLSIYG